MNPLNMAAAYMTSHHFQPANYGSSPAPSSSPPAPPPSTSESESRIDRTYLKSLRGILKLVCLVLCLVALICVVVTWGCYGTNAFLACVASLVIITQIGIVIIFLFQLNLTFAATDFELLDLYATSHDALYLLIASSAAIHYCRLPGQIAGGVIGILASLTLMGNAVTIILARRKESESES